MAAASAHLFLNTSYAIALGIPSDAAHARAAELADWLRANPAGLVTTRAVLVEIGDAFCRLRFRAAAVQALEAIESDPRIQIISLSDELYAEALELFRSRTDKEWGLTDCISFTVMHQLGLRDALTTDRHFEQAGFQALLR